MHARYCLLARSSKQNTVNEENLLIHSIEAIASVNELDIAIGPCELTMRK